jgi:hypothetical protein
MGDTFEVEVGGEVNGELSTPKGEWNDRPSARGWILDDWDSERTCLEKKRRVFDIVREWSVVKTRNVV